MSKMMIEDARVEVVPDNAETGLAVGEVRLRLPEGESTCMTLLEVDGTAMFLRSEESLMKTLLEEEDPAVVSDLCEQHTVFSGEYEELFEEPDELWMPVFRYLIYLVRSDWDETQSFLEATEGHALDEVEIPLSDVEEEYMESL